MVHCDHMKCLRGRRADKSRNFVALLERFYHFRKRHVGETVRVVREKNLFSGDQVLYGPQALSDEGAESRIDESDSPIFNVALNEIHFPAASRQNKVIRNAFVVVEEVILDFISLVAEAENEILVPKMGIVFHDVPQHGPIAQRHQGFRNIVAKFSKPRAQPPTEQHYFHKLLGN